MENAILQGIAVPTFAIDHRHLVSHFNPACENLTGISASEIIGTNRQWAPFYAWERPILADLIVDRAGQEVIERYYPGKVQASRVIPGAFEAQDFFPDLGEQGKWLFFTAAPMLDDSGAITGAIVTLQDITREMLTARQNETLSVENARISDQLKASYDQVCALNRTKDRALTHLSHELKTPVAILSGGLDLLDQALSQVQERNWRGTMDMLHRNLARIAGIQAEVQDIMKGAPAEVPELATRLLEQAGDELSLVVAQETGSPLAVEAVKDHLRKSYLPEESEPETILLGPWIERLVQALKPAWSHRSISVACLGQGHETVVMPEDVLHKVVEGLIRNAVENTPDQSRIDIEVSEQSGRTTVSIKDYGVGIDREDQGRIFEGLSPLQEALTYSTKQPFDFGAGGKCLDLLRIKIFSEQVGFGVALRSERCVHLAEKRVGACPGKIEACPACAGRQDCLESGGTVVTLTFAGPDGPDPGRPDPE